MFPLLRSETLVDWESAGCALVRPDAALGNTFWAPEVMYGQGQWWMYYSVGHDDSRHQLRVACSDDALGPYVDCAQLTNPDELPFAIDPIRSATLTGVGTCSTRATLDVADEDGGPPRGQAQPWSYSLWQR